MARMHFNYKNQIYSPTEIYFYCMPESILFFQAKLIPNHYNLVFPFRFNSHSNGFVEMAGMPTFQPNLIELLQRETTWMYS